MTPTGPDPHASYREHVSSEAEAVEEVDLAEYVSQHFHYDPEAGILTRTRTDNRLANLREASSFQNQWNAKRRRDNTSGYKGVTRSKSGRWFAKIKKHNKLTHLGTYDTPQEAHEAYCAAAREMHGEYANSGATA